MFAEQEMLGQATVSIDQKKRIILPPFTYREERRYFNPYQWVSRKLCRVNGI